MRPLQIVSGDGHEP